MLEVDMAPDGETVPTAAVVDAVPPATVAVPLLVDVPVTVTSASARTLDACEVYAPAWPVKELVAADVGEGA